MIQIDYLSDGLKLSAENTSCGWRGRMNISFVHSFSLFGVDGWGFRLALVSLSVSHQDLRP